MKWLLVAALWSTNPPQGNFRFYTEAFATKQECEEAVQALYAAAFDKGIHAQAMCKSRDALGFGPVY